VLKQALSGAESAVFQFDAGSVSLRRPVGRSEFESWIAPELRAIAAALDQALARARMTERDIDRVFLTGGSAFVPAVRRLFAERFGEARLEGGAELVSIASGLAYMGLEDDLDAWTQRRS
jgi:hypothetical chaperone protein